MPDGKDLGRKGTSARPRHFLAALVGLCLVAAPLFAQDVPGAQTLSLPDPRSLGLPSENTAFTLSLTATLASWGLLALTSAGGEAPSETTSAIQYIAGVGVFTGPSLGFFYGGCWGRGLLTTALRLGVTLAVATYALNHDEQDLTGLGLAGIGFFVASSIYDCATVKAAVRKHNAAHIARRGLNVAVAPFPLRKGAGLQVRLSF